MKKFIKILSIIILGMFAVTGCADIGNSDSNTNIQGGDTGNGGTGGDNTSGSDTLEYFDIFFDNITITGDMSYGMADGKTYIWGNVGELVGDGNTDITKHPLEVNFTIKDIITNPGKTNFFILTDKGLYSWGGIVAGSEEEYIKKAVKILEGDIKELIVVNISSYKNSYFAITDKGLYGWGNNTDGQLGIGSEEEYIKTATKVIDGNINGLSTDVGMMGDLRDNTREYIANSFYTSDIKTNTFFALTEDGVLYGWGDNSDGTVGVNSEEQYIKKATKVQGIKIIN